MSGDLIWNCRWQVASRMHINFTIARPLQRHSSLIALHQEDGIPLQSWQLTGNEVGIPVNSGILLTYSHQKL